MTTNRQLRHLHRPVCQLPQLPAGGGSRSWGGATGLRFDELRPTWSLEAAIHWRNPEDGADRRGLPIGKGGIELAKHESKHERKRQAKSELW